MRKLKLLLTVFFSLAVLVVLMRGPLYRSLFSYQDCGERERADGGGVPGDGLRRRCDPGRLARGAPRLRCARAS
jgi:hypothetical protein